MTDHSIELRRTAIALVRAHAYADSEAIRALLAPPLHYRLGDLLPVYWQLVVDAHALGGEDSLDTFLDAMLTELAVTNHREDA